MKAVSKWKIAKTHLASSLSQTVCRANRKLFLTLRTDSVESNREGGAMYIESSPNADGYVPNSSLFGPWIDSPTQVNYLRSRVSAKSVKVLQFEVTIVDEKSCDWKVELTVTKIYFREIFPTGKERKKSPTMHQLIRILTHLRNVLHRRPCVVIIAFSHCRRFTDRISSTAEIVSTLITRSGRRRNFSFLI